MFCSLGVIFEEKFAFKKLQNFWVAKALMSSYILCNIEFIKKAPSYKTEVFNALGSNSFGTVNHAIPVQY